MKNVSPILSYISLFFFEIEMDLSHFSPVSLSVQSGFNFFFKYFWSRIFHFSSNDFDFHNRDKKRLSVHFYTGLENHTYLVLGGYHWFRKVLKIYAENISGCQILVSWQNLVQKIFFFLASFSDESRENILHSSITYNFFRPQDVLKLHWQLDFTTWKPVCFCLFIFL